eukprot:gb/GECG01016564.1/.p1 GENE.gb/GECG01016564.1/~~gb/GECG01016564.1/.p1  ORF type:complete len:114 (+),score=6.96 gb/GECG01016564.1/:1-342(+)
MTCSFHKFGDYFPGTGDWRDLGYGNGKNYAINFPLKDGMDDESYRLVFRPIISQIMERFRYVCDLSNNETGELSSKSFGICVLQSKCRRAPVRRRLTLWRSSGLLQLICQRAC